MNNDKDYIITLDNGKRYVLVDKILYNKKEYVYLTCFDNFRDFIIGEVCGNTIIQVDDYNLFNQLVKEFDNKFNG